MEFHTDIEEVVGPFEEVVKEVCTELEKLYAETVKKDSYYEIRTMLHNSNNKDVFSALEETNEHNSYRIIGDWISYNKLDDIVYNFICYRFAEKGINIGEYDEEQRDIRTEVIDYITGLPIDVIE